MKKDEAARAMATTGILIEGLDAPPIEMKRTQPPDTTRDPDGKRVSSIPLAEERDDDTEGDETEGEEGEEVEEKQGKRADILGETKSLKQPNFSSSDEDDEEGDDNAAAVADLAQPLRQRAASSSGWRAKQSPSPFTDEMRENVRDKLLGIYNDLISDEDMDLYDTWTIPGLGKREIVAWSQCIDEGYEGTLEGWGEEVATKLSELKWVLMNTPLLATMAQDFPVGQNHRILVRNIITKIRRIIQGNMGTYPKRGKKLWRPQSLIDGEEQLKRFSSFLFISKKLPKDRDLLDLLELQMGELQRWLTEQWTSEFKDPMPADVAAEDLTKGLASKLVADFMAAKASRRADYMKANMDASTAIKSLQWRIDREKGFVQRKEVASKAQEETQKRKADEKQKRLERDRKAADDAAEEAARAELLRRKEARAEARQKNRLAARRGEEIDPTVADAGSDSSELSDPMEMYDPMPAMVPTPAPAAAPSVDIDHGALLLYGVSEETTEQLTIESDGLQVTMPTDDPAIQTELAQALEAVRIIAANTDVHDYKVWMRLVQGYKKAIENGFRKYADFFMKAIQKLQYANAKTFDYFSSKKGLLSQNQGYTDDASLRPGPPQPGINDEIKGVMNNWYVVFLYAQSSRFEREPYAEAIEAVARILRSLGSFDEGSWTTLVSAYRKAVEFEGDPGTITRYLYAAIQALYNVNPATRAYTMQLVGTIIPSEASEVAEEYDEEDFESDEEEEEDRPLTQTQLQPESQLPESQPPESPMQQWSNSEEDDDDAGGAPLTQTQLQPESQLPESQPPESQMQQWSDSEEDDDDATQLQPESQMQDSEEDDE